MRKNTKKNKKNKKNKHKNALLLCSHFYHSFTISDGMPVGSLQTSARRLQSVRLLCRLVGDDRSHSTSDGIQTVYLSDGMQTVCQNYVRLQLPSEIAYALAV